MFLEAISRFPLYLLFRCASQKDAAAIGANIECSFTSLSFRRMRKLIVILLRPPRQKFL